MVFDTHSAAHPCTPTLPNTQEPHSFQPANPFDLSEQLLQSPSHTKPLCFAPCLTGPCTAPSPLGSLCPHTQAMYLVCSRTCLPSLPCVGDVKRCCVHVCRCRLLPPCPTGGWRMQSQSGRPARGSWCTREASRGTRQSRCDTPSAHRVQRLLHAWQRDTYCDPWVTRCLCC